MKAILLCALLVACGGSPGGDDDTNPNPDGANPDPDSAVIPPGYVRLIGRTWNVSAPTSSSPDEYRCVRLTVPEDMYITSIQAQAPVGTHHTVLSFAGANGTSGPDGNDDGCSFSTLGMVMLYASGTNEGLFDFPDGVGVKIPAGQQIHLNIHLFNATDEALSGDTAILVKSSPTPPPMLAEMVFAGGVGFVIPKAQDPQNPPDTKFTGGCISDRSYSLFAVWPHQHQLGTHHKVTITRGAAETVLHDGAYDFREQNYYPQVPIFDVMPGDNIKVECTWRNTTNALVRFGESSTQEMCFSGFYRFPAQNEGLFQCTDFLGN